MKNLLVPIDFSDMTERVVARAGDVALAFGSTVRLLHVAAPDPSIASSRMWPQEVRDELAKELLSEHGEIEDYAELLKARGIEAKALLARGDIADTILEFAEKTETDLIIVGSHRKGAFAELLPRSVVKGLLRRTLCPVMVVPEEKSETRNSKSE